MVRSPSRPATLAHWRSVALTGAAILMTTSCGDVPPSGAAEVVSQQATAAVSGTALLVVGNTTLSASDALLSKRLKALGLTVVTKLDSAAVPGDATGKAVVVLSESVRSGNVNTKFRDVSTAVVCMDSALYDDLQMTGPTLNTDYGDAATQTDIAVNVAGQAFAPRVTLTVSNSAQTFSWGKPAFTAEVTATLAGSDAAAVFVYERGSAMVGLNAPGRRAGFFAGHATPAALNAHGLDLLDSTMRWAAGPALFFSPASKKFGDVTVGTTSAIQTFTLTNRGGSPTSMLAVGSGSSQEEIVSQTCPPVLAPGQSCTVDVRFKAILPGFESSEIAATCPGAIARAALSGNAIPALHDVLFVEPRNGRFGYLPVGADSGLANFRITNGGLATANITASVVTNKFGLYDVVSNDCVSVPLNGSCFVKVRYRAQFTGSEESVLLLTSPVTTPQAATLIGTGVTSPLRVSPSSVVFPDTPRGSQSALTTFTVTNTGTSDVAGVWYSTTGNDFNQFVVGPATCNGDTLPPGGMCTISMAFKPDRGGFDVAELNVTAGGGGVFSVLLSGVGL